MRHDNLAQILTQLGLLICSTATRPCGKQKVSVPAVAAMNDVSTSPSSATTPI